jgi:hypothetical protein
MKQTLENIMNTFPITQSEYEVLDKKFGKLAYYAAWELKRKNVQNSGTNDPEDDAQELRIALIRAGSYYKRQTYIEQCFEALTQHVEDNFTKKIVAELQQLWEDRRRHGANRQKFGLYQEVILDRLVQHNVPSDLRPNRNATLKIDGKFVTYCKQIVWNAQKSLGKKITREKPLRTGMVSLSEFDHMGMAL